MSNTEDNKDLPENENGSETTAEPTNEEAMVEEVSADSEQAADEGGAQADASSDADSEAGEVSEVEQEAEQQVAREEEGEAQEGSEEPIMIPNLAQIIEGAVLAADKPLSIDHIIQLFPDHEPTRKQVREAIAEIQENCEGRGFEFKEVASGYRFQVRAEYGDWIGRLWEEKPPRYTRALLETLALIAYKQPITRGDIEEIRGVSVSTNIIRTLLEREWIRVVGHRDVPGRPSIYATTKTFLDYFDLSSLDELPTLSEIKDLDKVNAELDLEGQELIEPRTLNLEEGDAEAVAQAEAEDDEALDEVTDRVNEISENIKNLFKEPVEDDIDLDEEPSAEVEEEPSAEVEEEPSAEVEEEPSAEVEEEPSAEVEEEPSAEVEKEPSAEVEEESSAEVEKEPSAEVDSSELSEEQSADDSDDSENNPDRSF